MEWALGVLVDLISHLELLMYLPIALFIHPIKTLFFPVGFLFLHVATLFSLVASLFAPFPFPLNISLLPKALVVVLHKICLLVASCSNHVETT